MAIFTLAMVRQQDNASSVRKLLPSERSAIPVKETASGFFHIQ